MKNEGSNLFFQSQILKEIFEKVAVKGKKENADQIIDEYLAQIKVLEKKINEYNEKLTKEEGVSFLKKVIRSIVLKLRGKLKFFRTKVKDQILEEFEEEFAQILQHLRHASFIDLVAIRQLMKDHNFKIDRSKPIEAQLKEEIKRCKVSPDFSDRMKSKRNLLERFLQMVFKSKQHQEFVRSRSLKKSRGRDREIGRNS